MMRRVKEAGRRRQILGFDANIFWMGMTSFFTDFSTEMIYPLIPVFVVSVLNASAASLGIIEGIAESTAALTRVASGYISDRLRIRKPLAVIGYLLPCIAKPFLAIAQTPVHVGLVRFTDRLGKGIRVAPRDALLATSADRKRFGKAFGFHRLMDNLGAAVAPLAAVVLLAIFQVSKNPNHLRSIFIVAGAIGLIGVYFIAANVEERVPERKTDAEGMKPPVRLRLADLPARYKVFLLGTIVFSLANSSDMFLILKAQSVGVALVVIPLLYFTMNMVYGLVSYPAGVISDRIPRLPVITLGMAIYALTYFSMGRATTVLSVWLLFALYGVYNALTEGVGKALVADLVDDERRAFAYGLQYTAAGVCLFPASLLMGFLWKLAGHQLAFTVDAALALVGAVVLLVGFRMTKR